MTLITSLPRFTRQGIPTPVQPDFSNLKAQWATLTPTGVALSAYSGASVTPRPCPSSTAGGWAVDPNSPLPTIGQTAIQPDDGAASATGNLTAVQTADSGTASATGQSATSTPAQGNAVQSTPNILAFDDGSLAGCVAALLTVGLAMVLLL